MVFEKIQELITDQFGIETDDIELKSRLYEDIGAEDVDVIELLMHIEEEFSIIIPEEEVPAIKKIDDIVEYVKSVI